MPRWPLVMGLSLSHFCSWFTKLDFGATHSLVCCQFPVCSHHLEVSHSITVVRCQGSIEGELTFIHP